MSVTPDFLVNSSTIYDPTEQSVVDLSLLVNSSQIDGGSFFGPDEITNTSTVYNPRVQVVFKPSTIANVSTIFSPITEDDVQRPNFLVNPNRIYFPRIGPSNRNVTPNFLVNDSTVYSLSPDIVKNFVTVVNHSVVFPASPVYARTIRVPFIPSTSIVPKIIMKMQPVTAHPVAPIPAVRSSFTLTGSESLTTDVNTTFRDVSIMFRPHPLTGDLTRVFDYDAVNQAIKVIVFTNFYERPFQSQMIAGNINAHLFELGGTMTTNDIQEQIALAIVKWDDRVVLQNVTVTDDPQNDAVEVTITYNIKTFTQTATLTLFLERA